MKYLAIIRSMLQKFIDDIDSGNCNLSKEEFVAIIDELAKFNTSNSCMSKAEASSYLHLSRPTFDRLVSEGKIPQGRHMKGFKELSWSKSDLDKVIL